MKCIRLNHEYFLVTPLTGTSVSNDHHLLLPDDRKLSYATLGPSDGQPVLYFHGSPSSRLEPLFLSPDVLNQFKLRIIAPDRPGMGGSDFQTDRSFSHWPADVVALADSLGIQRFAVMGNSGGGPYVAVCAARIPERLRAAVIVSGGWRMDWPESKKNLPFVNRLVMNLARYAPFLLRLMLSAMGNIAQGEREKELVQLKKRMPPADYEALTKPGQLEAFGQSIRESLRQGTKGPVWDLQQYVHEIDFRLDEIRMPLTLFHGEKDVNSPIALIRRVFKELPTARLISYPNEAHLSTLINHQEEIAKALVSLPESVQ